MPPPEGGSGNASKFHKFLLKFDEKLSNLGRPVLVRIDEFLNFLFDLGQNLILFCNFISRNIKICKKEERNILMKIIIFSDFPTLRRTLWANFLRNFGFCR